MYLAVAAVFAVGTPAFGQTPAPQMPQVPDSIQEMIQEAQQLQQRLAGIQQAAIEKNPELAERQQQLSDLVESTMVELDADIEKKADRLGELQQEAQAASQSGDQAALQKLMQEGGEIQQQLQLVQQQALESPAVQEQVEAYQSELLSEMKDVDAETETLIEQLTELAERLQKIMPQG